MTTLRVPSAYPPRAAPCSATPVRTRSHPHTHVLWGQGLGLRWNDPSPVAPPQCGSARPDPVFPSTLLRGCYCLERSEPEGALAPRVLGLPAPAPPPPVRRLPGAQDTCGDPGSESVRRAH